MRRRPGEAMMRRKSLETSDISGWLLLGTLAMMCSMRTSGNDSKEVTSSGCSCGFLFGAPPLSPSGMSEITAIVAV